MPCIHCKIVRTVIAGIQAPLSCGGDVIWSQPLQRRRGNPLPKLECQSRCITLFSQHQCTKTSSNKFYFKLSIFSKSYKVQLPWEGFMSLLDFYCKQLWFWRFPVDLEVPNKLLLQKCIHPHYIVIESFCLIGKRFKWSVVFNSCRLLHVGTEKFEP